MFGWFRKRKRPENPAVDAPAEQTLDHAPASPPAPADQQQAIGPQQAANQQSHPSQQHAVQPQAVQPQAAPQQAVQPQPASEWGVQHGSAQQHGPAPQHGPVPQHGPAQRTPAAQDTQHQVADAHAQQRGNRQVGTVAFAPPVAAPSLRPAMPLSDHPNFAGLGLAQPEGTPPRLLDPEAALTDEARDELTSLLLDMFGPRGRYRLEWRADREPGDDAMFSEIMVADLVRRIQNSIAVSSDLELRAAPLRLAIEAMPGRSGDGDDASDSDADSANGEAPDSDGSGDDEHRSADSETADDNAADDSAADDGAADDGAADDERSEASSSDAVPANEHASADASSLEARRAAINEFLSPAETLEDLAAATEPDRALPHGDSHEVDGDRRIA